MAVEQVKGALVFTLSKYEPLHLFPVPPAMSAKLREALYPSGAKDDPRDRLIIESAGNSSHSSMSYSASRPQAKARAKTIRRRKAAPKGRRHEVITD